MKIDEKFLEKNIQLYIHLSGDKDAFMEAQLIKIFSYLDGFYKGIEILMEIRQKIDGLRYDHLIGNVSNYAVIDTALEIIDAHIEEEQDAQ
jgi:hypothetical protein